MRTLYHTSFPYANLISDTALHPAIFSAGSSLPLPVTRPKVKARQPPQTHSQVAGAASIPAGIGQGCASTAAAGAKPGQRQQRKRGRGRLWHSLSVCNAHRVILAIIAEHQAGIARQVAEIISRSHLFLLHE